MMIERTTLTPNNVVLMAKRRRNVAKFRLTKKVEIKDFNLLKMYNNWQ